MITDAIKSAQTKHALYFLLTAYVETLAFNAADGIPEKVKRLPISGKTDVRKRSEVMRNVLQEPAPDKQVVPVIEEAADVFDVAAEQLEKL
jgi:hypothetical protein